MLNSRGTFTLQLRATATLGVVFFATNDKHTDHIGLFISNGKLIFSFSAGNAVVRLQIMLRKKGNF